MRISRKHIARLPNPKGVPDSMMSGAPFAYLEYVLIETLCVSIHTLPTLPRKAGQARFPSGLDKSRLLTARASALPAKLDKRVRQSDCHFQWHFALVSRCKNKDVNIYYSKN